MAKKRNGAEGCLRLGHTLKLSDAIQLDEGCSALVTHDRDFGAVSGLLVLGAARRAR